jgi:hypothetical protein
MPCLGRSEYAKGCKIYTKKESEEEEAECISQTNNPNIKSRTSACSEKPSTEASIISRLISN